MAEDKVVKLEAELARVTGERDAAEKALAKRTAEVIEAARQEVASIAATLRCGVSEPETFQLLEECVCDALLSRLDALASRYAATPPTSAEGPAPDHKEE